MTTLRLVTILVLGAGLAAGVVACASDRVEPSVEDATAPTPAASHGGRPTGPPDPSQVAEAGTSGAWRRSPVRPTPAFAAAAEGACRAHQAVGAKLPLAVLDARGERLAILVFADAKAAAVCRAVVAADGAATAVAEALPDEARAAPPENGTLGGHDMTFVENGNAQIGVLVGTVKEPIQDVSINMDADAAWFATSKANGWYAIWWPGTDKPLTVASSNRSIVVDGYTP